MPLGDRVDDDSAALLDAGAFASPDPGGMDVEALVAPASMRGRAFWSFADQALSSLTNAGLSVVVARTVGQSAFGAFSLVLVTFSFVIGIGRAVICDVFVIQFSDVSDQVRRTAARRASGGAVAFGVLSGVLCALAAVAVPTGQARSALFALALALPGLLLQDCFRFVFFAAARPAAAALNDLIWAIIQFSLIGVLIASGRTSIFLITLAWGFAALVAALTACAQARLLPAPRQAGSWFVVNRGLNVRLGIDYVLNMGAVNLATYLITAIVGLAGVAALRAAQILLGPLLLLWSGSAAFVLPVLSTLAGQGRSLIRFATLASAALTALAVAWVAVLLVLPSALGRQLLGDSWAGADTVMLASGTAIVLTTLSLGPSLALRALRRPDLLLRVTALQSPFILGLGVAGAFWRGAPGAAEGFALAQSVGAVTIWVLFLRADGRPRDFGGASAPAST